MVDLVGCEGTRCGPLAETISYWPFPYRDRRQTPLGGADFAWDPRCPKAAHNGGSVVSPTVPWDGKENSFADYLAGVGETSPRGSGCWVHRNGGPPFDAAQWGCRVDGTTIANDAMLQPLLDHAERAISGGFGGVVLLPAGAIHFTRHLHVRDRTTLRGAGTSRTVLKCVGTAPGSPINLGPRGPHNPLPANRGAYVFACRLENMSISGADIDRGANAALIHTHGAHEHSGVFQCTVRNWRNWGIHYDGGRGGPSFFKIDSCELFSSDAAPDAGDKRGLVCSAGGAIVEVGQLSIVGGLARRLAVGLDMRTDHLRISGGLHFEMCDVGLRINQSGPPKYRDKFTVSGGGVSGNWSVATLVQIAPTFAGAINLAGLSQASRVPDLVVVDNQAAGEIVTHTCASYVWPPADAPTAPLAWALIAGKTGTIRRQRGRPFTLTRDQTGVLTGTFVTPLADADYLGLATATDAQAMLTAHVEVLAEDRFRIRILDQAGAPRDADKLGLTIYG